MDRFTIITNNRWREFRFRYEVPESVLKTQFDYQNPDDASDGFFCYKGYWYHLDDFMRIPHGTTEMEGWSGYHSDSFFSGILIRLSDDCECFIVGRYYS